MNVMDSTLVKWPFPLESSLHYEYCPLMEISFKLILKCFKEEFPRTDKNYCGIILSNYKLFSGKAFSKTYQPCPLGVRSQHRLAERL